ncbi:hypothetical protein KR084_007444, partial [Drosophila pseudotakahashii]
VNYYTLHQRDKFAEILEAGILNCTTQYRSYRDDLNKAYVLLASYFTYMAYKALGKRRQVLKAKAINYIRVLDGNERRSKDLRFHVVKGFAQMLSESRAQGADGLFVSVLRQKSDHILALIGRGCLAFNRQDYVGSLGYFKSVLMSQPRGPGDVRIGIGHCFLSMGELDSARRSFELALRYNGRCQNALLGMALLKLNQREEASYREGVNLLIAAYEMNKRHPVVLSILATHYYFRGNHKRVWILAGNAHRNTEIPQLKSHTCYQIARSFHASGQFDLARIYYLHSVRLAPEGYVLAQMGLAQMHLRGGDVEKAKRCLEIFLKSLPDESSAMRLLAKIYLRDRSPGEINRAIEMLVKVVTRKAGRQDIDSWLMLALAYEQKSLWSQSIDSYQEAKRIYLGQGHLKIPVEWLNNLAAVQQLAKQPQAALATLDEAFSQFGTQNAGDCRTDVLLTLRFNRGRILEDLHRDNLAVEQYQSIIKDYPKYHTCSMRLGIMAMRQNKLNVATEHFKDILGEDNDNLVARSYLGDCFTKLELHKHAFNNYNAILSICEEDDSFSLMSLGNACLRKCQSFVMKKDLSSARKLQGKALYLYERILHDHGRNIWAANGIGAVMGTCRFFSDAEHVFREIVEAGSECMPATLNSAHIALELGQFRLASQTYKLCLQDLMQENCVAVMTCLAKSLYGEGKVREAKMLLLKARHVAPQDQHVMFNLALVIKEDTKRILALPLPEWEDLQKAELELKVAYHYFYHLNLTLTEISVRSTAKGFSDCQNLMNKLLDELETVRSLQLSKEQRIRLQEQRILDHRLQLEEQRQQGQEENRILQENQMAKRQETLERTRKIMNAPLQSELPKKDSSKGKKRARKDQRDKEEEENINELPKSKKRAIQKSRKRAATQELDNGAYKKPKSKEFVSTDDDSES